MATAAEKILSQKGIVLSKDNLERFKIKSESLVPACFGGFNPDDPVCKSYCFRARRNDLESASWKVEEKMNEKSPSRGGFFYRDFKFQESCQQKREGLAARLINISKEIKKELECYDSQRAIRDKYCLGEDSTGMGRIPVGEIKDAEDFRDFTKSNILYLETKDTRHYPHPYGPRYNDAVGKIYEIHPGGCPPFFASTGLGFIKSITPELPDAWRYRIKVVNQTVNKDGDLVLEAQVDYSKNNSNEVMDIHKVNGTKLTIVVYGKSAKEDIRVDDVGKI